MTTPTPVPVLPPAGTEPTKDTDPLNPDPANPDQNQLAAHLKYLKDVQGNILKSHGRRFVRLVLFRFVSVFERDPSLRALLQAAASDTNHDAVGTYWKVTSALQQWQDARNQASDPNAPFYSLGLTYSGLTRCDFQDDELPLTEPNSTASHPNTGFSTLMKAVAVLDALGDAISTDKSGPADWETIYRDGVDGVWVLANNDLVQLDAMERRVSEFLVKYRAIKVAVEKGFTWTDKDNLPREPFGFRDAISDPIFFASDCYVGAGGVARVPKWVNIARKQVVIDWRDPKDATGKTPNVHNGGSFLVLRKLEQNVKAFRDTERAIEGAYAHPDPTAKLPLPPQAGALMIGRSRDGKPLADFVEPLDPKLDKDGANRFDFGTDQTRCPFHAHIRKSAPRVPDTPPPALPLHHDTLSARDALFVRRSAIYDSYGQLPAGGTLTDDPAAQPPLQPAHAYQSRNGDDISGQVGLLFMGYMSNITMQFQKLQSDWFGEPSFPFRINNGLIDPVLRNNGAGGPTKAPGWQWSMLPKANVDFSSVPIIVPKGGAYFYVPPILWLQRPLKAVPFWHKLVRPVLELFSALRFSRR